MILYSKLKIIPLLTWSMYIYIYTHCFVYLDLNATFILNYLQTKIKILFKTYNFVVYINSIFLILDCRLCRTSLHALFFKNYKQKPATFKSSKYTIMIELIYVLSKNKECRLVQFISSSVTLIRVLSLGIINLTDINS